MGEIDSEKVNKTKEDIIQSVKEISMFRNLLPKEKVSLAYNKVEFSKIGIKLLLEKNFFQKEEDNGTTCWVWDTIGRMHGSDLGRAENEFVIKKIKESLRVIKEDKNFSIEEVYKSLLEIADPDQSIIIINLKDSMELYKNIKFDSRYNIKNRREEHSLFYMGKFYQTEVYGLGELEDGEVIILDKNEFATILFKMDLTEDIEKIKFIEKITPEQINNPKLKDTDLSNKIILFTEEVLALEIQNVTKGRYLLFKS